MSNNEYRQIYGECYTPQSAKAWRRKPDCPEWSVDVRFGDDGDPGVYGVSLEQAIEEVDQAIAELSAMLKALGDLYCETVEEKIREESENG